MLKITASSATDPNVNPVKAVLRTILIEKGIIANGPRPFDGLLTSLKASKKWSPSPNTYAFIDNCMGRAVRQPVRYLDLSALTLGGDAESSSHGIFVACIAEQWPFVVKIDDSDTQKNIAEWIARFFSALGVDEEDASLSKTAMTRNGMIEATEGVAGSILEKAFKKQSKHPVKLEFSEVPHALQTGGDTEMDDAEEKPSEIVLEDMFGMPASSPHSIQGLDRWDGAGLESAISSGRVGRLLQCVTSEEEEIRRQAALILGQLMAIVEV